MKIINDSIRFLLELTTLVLLIMSGWQLPVITAKLGVGVALPVAVILFWGRYMAPKSAVRFGDLGRGFSELMIFGGTFLLVYFLFNRPVAWVYLIVAMVNTVLDHWLK